MNAIYQYLTFCLLMLTFGTTRMRMRKQARTREEKCHAVVEMHLHAAKAASPLSIIFSSNL